ncbi:MAG: hypothetical protein R2874_03450 [Desulfobacterales bacterium]
MNWGFGPGHCRTRKSSIRQRGGRRFDCRRPHTKIKDCRWYAGSAERTAFRSDRPAVVVTDPQAPLSRDENQDASVIGKDKDRLIHVFTRKRKH